MSLFFRPVTVGLALLLLACPTRAQTPAPPAAPAQSRDAPALKTIDLAINTHYLATNFDTAEKLLRAAIEDCRNQCSPKVLAKTWAYLGIVLTTGKNDKPAASDAFIRALSLDPAIKLDAALATPEVNELFQALGVPGMPTANMTGPAAALPATPASGLTSLSCTPSVSEVETRRPIPVQCRTDQDVKLAQLRYKAAADKTWSTLPLAKKGNDYEAEIPCSATDTVGILELYARVEDANGEDVGTWGTKAAPVQIRLVPSSKEEPPSLRNAEPKARCAEKQECPPDFPGCVNAKRGGDTDWGGGCDNSGQCKVGLLCLDGTCENAPSCARDEDCSVGRCVQNKCSAVAGDSGLSHDAHKNWVGLHVAQDFALVRGTDVCSQASQSGQYWGCYYSGSNTAAYMNEPDPGVKVGGGFAIATTRVLVSYDRVLTPNLSVGTRLGFAFGGGPPLQRAVQYEPGTTNVQTVVATGNKFMALHAELRATYWFGPSAFTHKLRPYLHLGGGLAAVDVKFKVPALEAGREVPLDAWKRLGLQFAMIGGGLAYGISDRLALQANLNVLYTLPSAAVVVQPSVGAMAGF